MKSQIVLALAALALVAPVAAQAQDVPSYAAGDDQENAGDQQIRGRVLSFDGAYSLAVRDDQGYVDNVELHQGTIINPTGLTLEPGMVVSILGYNSGPYLSANEVDTPYTYAGGGIPYYSGHPWNYYGPTIGLSFFFGSGGGWWHGGDYPRYDYAGRSRVYNDVHISNVYRGNDQYRGETPYRGNAQYGGNARYRGDEQYQGRATGAYDASRRYPQGGYRENGGAYSGGGNVRRDAVQRENVQRAPANGNAQRSYQPGGTAGAYRGDAAARGGEQRGGDRQGGSRGETHGGSDRGGDAHGR